MSSSCWRPCGTNRTGGCATAIVISGAWRSRPSTWGSGSTCPTRRRRCVHGRRKATRHGSGCGCGAPERWPSTWSRSPRPCRARSSSRSTTTRSTRTSGGSTTRRRSGSPTSVGGCGGPTSTTSSWSTRTVSSPRSPGPPSRWTSTGPGARPRCRPGACRASSGPACSTAASCTSGCSGTRIWTAARGLAVISSLRGWRTARLLVSSGPAAEGGDDVRREHQVVGRDSGRPGPAVAGQLHP